MPCGAEYCQRITLRYALSVGVHHAEIVLCSGESLIGCLAVPNRRLYVVLGHTLAVVVFYAEAMLAIASPLQLVA